MGNGLNYLGSAARTGPGACGDIEPSVEFYAMNNAIFMKEYAGYEGEYQEQKKLIYLHTDLGPVEMRSIVKKLDFDTITTLIQDMACRKEDFEHLPPTAYDLELFLIKASLKLEEKIEFYRRKNVNPGKYEGTFFSGKIYFHNTSNPDMIKKYSGALLEWNEKSFRKFVKSLDFKELSIALDDISSKDYFESVCLPMPNKKIHNKIIISSEYSSECYSFQEWGKQILMSCSPQHSADSSAFAQNSVNYVYSGSLSSQQILNIVKKLDFKEADILFKDWTRPPKSGQCFMPEPEQKKLILEYHKEDNEGKRIDVFDLRGWRNHLFFREYPQPNKLKVCTGEITSMLHPMHDKSLFKKLNLDELCALLNDVQEIHENDWKI